MSEVKYVENKIISRADAIASYGGGIRQNAGVEV